ncbi:MAG: HEAT repeat domain-containing protein [Desertifilum sp. SIO1I2]|nr:HEAT repeat domain-containing protein [Desertifilum sp. SIO1I2]
MQNLQMLEAQVSTHPRILDLIAQLSDRHPARAAAAAQELVPLGQDCTLALLAAYPQVDRGVQAAIIQVLARIADPLAFDLLLEVVGVAVANHCQGNVRRVAARGLGQMALNSGDLGLVRRAVDRLAWAIAHAEDWALRYAAVVSLQELASPEAIAVLQAAEASEGDRVVRSRLQMAIAALSSHQAGLDA